MEIHRHGKARPWIQTGLVKRYDKEMLKKNADGEWDGGDEGRPRPMPPHASGNPMMVMVDESTGIKYMRAVGHIDLEGQGDNSWLVRDLHKELKS